MQATHFIILITEKNCMFSHTATTIYKKINNKFIGRHNLEERPGDANVSESPSQM